MPDLLTKVHENWLATKRIEDRQQVMMATDIFILSILAAIVVKLWRSLR